MLSIRFDSGNTWWVSTTAFSRLFETAMKNGAMAPPLESWLHVAEANGGLNLSRLDRAEADRLIAALVSTAEQEIQRLRDADVKSQDGSYRVSLEKLLAALEQHA